MRFTALIKREADALRALKAWVIEFRDSVIVIKRIFGAVINGVFYLNIRINKFKKII